MVVSKQHACKWSSDETYERNALGLREEKEDKRSAHGSEDTEEDIGAITKMRKHIRGDLADDEVVHPVGRSTERDTVRTVGHGPDLCDDDPSTRTP